MRIEETLLAKKIIIEVADPYDMALKLMDSVSGFGKVVERENRYETDGPSRRMVLNFEMMESIDRVSHATIEFLTRGETNNVNYLEIEVTGKFVTEIKSTGFLAAVFAEYYTKHIFPRYMKSADEKMKRVEKSVLDFVSSFRKQKQAVRKEQS